MIDRGVRRLWLCHFRMRSEGSCFKEAVFWWWRLLLLGRFCVCRRSVRRRRARASEQRSTWPPRWNPDPFWLVVCLCSNQTKTPNLSIPVAQQRTTKPCGRHADATALIGEQHLGGGNRRAPCYDAHTHILTLSPWRERESARSINREAPKVFALRVGSGARTPPSLLALLRCLT